MSERLSTSSLKLLALLTAAMLLLCSCSDVSDTESTSAPSEKTESDASEPSEEQEYEYNRYEVSQLLLNDKLVHGIFAGGYLSDGQTTDGYYAATGEYALFSSVEKLLSETYDADCRMTDYYLSYPEYGRNSVICGDSGETLYYYHYIDDNVISISNFAIDGDTVSVGGTSVPLVRTDSGVRLGGTLYATENGTASPIGEYMDSGSAKKLCGNYAVVILLMSENKYDMPSEVEDAFSSVVGSALDTVSQIAKEHGGSISFDTSMARLAHSDSFVGGFDLDMIFAATSFHTLGGLVESQVDTGLYDGYFVVACSRDVSGASFTAYCEGSPEGFFCERAVIGTDAKSDDVASAVLSLFGAETYDDLMSEYFDADIICGGAGLCAVNAYRVGLTDSLDIQLCQFIN